MIVYCDQEIVTNILLKAKLTRASKHQYYTARCTKSELYKHLGLFFSDIDIKPCHNRTSNILV